MLWLALLPLVFAAPQPSTQTLIYYNARMALREGQALEAVKLWLLRNALEDQTQQLSPHDADFRSVTWVALGDLGVCQDGQPTDEDGAGLWPLALHNWIVRNMGRRRRSGLPRPFDAFEVNRQQRFVAIGDVLSPQELKTVTLFRGRCARPIMALTAAGERPGANLSDREVVARLLRHLLKQARGTLAADLVRGQSVIDARLFDINLQLAELAEREARQKAREEAQRGRQIGLSRVILDSLRAEAPDTSLKPGSESARILEDSARWTTAEWMALSPDRRVFLYDQARAWVGTPEAFDRVALGVLDQLIAQGDGEEVERWIPRAAAATDTAVIWSGRRGQALLALDEEAGF
ncbi:MAG: hypothetical protein H6740_28890, partial [Alphaproteobacteria bacterium]|nr:hypothetical protein [Alphaproteobacteria bacterium]